MKWDLRKSIPLLIKAFKKPAPRAISKKVVIKTTRKKPTGHKAYTRSVKGKTVSVKAKGFVSQRKPSLKELKLTNQALKMIPNSPKQLKVRAEIKKLKENEENPLLQLEFLKQFAKKATDKGTRSRRQGLEFYSNLPIVRFTSFDGIKKYVQPGEHIGVHIVTKKHDVVVRAMTTRWDSGKLYFSVGSAMGEGSEEFPKGREFYVSAKNFQKYKDITVGKHHFKRIQGQFTEELNSIAADAVQTVNDIRKFADKFYKEEDKSDPVIRQLIKRFNILRNKMTGVMLGAMPHNVPYSVVQNLREEGRSVQAAFEAIAMDKTRAITNLQQRIQERASQEAQVEHSKAWEELHKEPESAVDYHSVVEKWFNKNKIAKREKWKKNMVSGGTWLKAEAHRIQNEKGWKKLTPKRTAELKKLTRASLNEYLDTKLEEERKSLHNPTREQKEKVVAIERARLKKMKEKSKDNALWKEVTKKPATNLVVKEKREAQSTQAVQDRNKRREENQKIYFGEKLVIKI